MGGFSHGAGLSAYNESLCSGREGEEENQLRNSLVLLIANLERTGSRVLTDYQKKVLESTPACARFARYLTRVKELVTAVDSGSSPKIGAFIKGFQSGSNGVIATLSNGGTLTARYAGSYYDFQRNASVNKYESTTNGLTFLLPSSSEFDNTETRSETTSCTISESYEDCYWQHDKVTDRYTKVCENKTRYIDGTINYTYESGERIKTTDYIVLKGNESVAEYFDRSVTPINEYPSSSSDCVRNR